MSEIREDPWCLTLSEDMMDERDFKAWEAIQIDWEEELPKSFSLGKWVRNTNYQNGRGSCTANATSHGVQILAVKKKWILPTTHNIITPDWKDLRTKMWHDLDDKNDSWDYVEKAVSTALKMWINSVESDIVKYDWYCYGERDMTKKSIETMKHYLYNGCPIVRCLRWNKTTWNEITDWQLKTFVPITQRTWWHAVALVGRDEWWLRFLNSWRTNDWKGFKSRFYVTYQDMIKLGGTFNWRYRILYNKEIAKQDPNYLRKKWNALESLKSLKKLYPEETPQVQRLIESLSVELRRHYPEINEELPL